MIDPKWLVIGVALISVSLIFNYSVTLGLAAGTLLALVTAIYLWISIRLAPEHGAPRSEREALFSRFARIGRNRRAAQLKELSAQRGADPRQRP